MMMIWFDFDSKKETLLMIYDLMMKMCSSVKVVLSVA